YVPRTTRPSFKVTVSANAANANTRASPIADRRVNLLIPISPPPIVRRVTSPFGLRRFAHRLRHLCAVVVGVLVNGLALFMRERRTALVEPLDGLAYQEGGRIGDGSFGNQAAAERDFARQFPREGAPSEGAAHDGQHRSLLFQKADLVRV